MDLVHLKVVAGFVFLLLALLFGWTPLILVRFIKTENGEPTHSLTQHLHALASGILLATCLLHLLPESVQAVQDAMAVSTKSKDCPISSQVNISGFQSVCDCVKLEDMDVIDNGGMYPIAELMVALGFLLIYCMETLFNSWQVSGKDENIEMTALTTVTELKKDGRSLYKKHDHFTEQASDQSKLLEKSPKGKMISPFDSENNLGIPNNGNSIDEDESFREISKCDTEPLNEFSMSKEDHPLAESGRLRDVKHTAPDVRSVALVAALCIHGFFDGVMLGLQTSENVLLSLLLALSLHKSFVSVSLALTLLNNRQTVIQSTTRLIRTELLHIFLFACAAPLGLALSSLFVHTTFDTNIDHDKSDDGGVSVLPGCLQAFAVGTFLYVTFSELIEHSKQDKHNYTESRRKLFVRTLINHLFLFVGFTFMAWLRAALGDS